MTRYITVNEADASKRLVKRQDMVPCKVAFIDCKMKGSDLKENYSLIGAGVTQSEDQVVNIQEPHGFSLGVAAMPPGVVNNLHVHYTAEVFMIFKGRWRFRWGANGDEGTVIGEPGDVLSIPTWIFRGFSNVGDDDGWIFSALGGDDTGGIIWHPSILEQAGRHGLYLTKNNMLVDTSKGAPKPSPEELIEPIDDDALRGLRRYAPEEMRQRLVKVDDRVWSQHALLDSVLPGHGAEVASVIGFGISQDRNAQPAVANPHGFSIEWLRVGVGEQIGKHALDTKQVLIVFEGAAEITLNDVRHETRVTVPQQALFSVPANAWRSIRSVGDAPLLIAAMTSGDQKKHIEWAPEIVAAAANEGWGVDHNGYVAPLHLLPYELRKAAQAL
ncbi:cupin domain-containing protein [Caballeronia sp. INDeC2]|uniref:cupin domain-containing protein n=1 Tax=Caballeronia sp. INDeC2 TaxID=2921747 RepID=UPI002027C047|nr:cupin domain-containing protein [Caballeronia sp. INDeC2]